MPESAPARLLCADATAAPAPDGSRLRVPRLGIGWRLGLGLAAVAALLVAGEQMATRTTREALDAVVSMQKEQPLTDSANAALEKMLAYDRAVGEYAQAPSTAGLGAITVAGDAVEAALSDYLRNSPPPSLVRSAEALHTQITRHIAVARALATRLAQRAQWGDERQAALNRVYQRIAAAGGSGLAINGTQVIANRSLAELESAINAVRGSVVTGAALARRERDFIASLASHLQDLETSPGKAWLELVRRDFSQAVRLRGQIERYDTQSAPEWHQLFEESAALTAGVQNELEKPASRGLVRAAKHAATAAQGAEHTLRSTAAAVLALLLLVSVLLTVSISLPVRRLTAATRAFAAGDRVARARRGGPAELDQLAASFNTMADRIASAEGELLAHQAKLERHVAERTRQLHHLAHHDPLTQLPNRRKLMAQLEQAL
ncbi:MAG: HAMP domain-containing protein, partial [Gammaproteobacteria bacterium]|nr:HAMP domain-containing protein [Gammaproteobacteria bacterium]